MFSDIPKFPSETYLDAVLALKNPRGPAVVFRTLHTSIGAVVMLCQANLLKAHRKAMVMAWQEARQLQAVPPSNNGQRQLAASVLGEFMKVEPSDIPGFTRPPQRIIHNHADYTHALQYYRYHLYSRRHLWAKIP